LAFKGIKKRTRGGNMSRETLEFVIISKLMKARKVRQMTCGRNVRNMTQGYKILAGKYKGVRIILKCNLKRHLKH
jgi:hypothetical protein